MKQWVYTSMIALAMTSTTAWGYDGPNPSEVYVNGINTGGTGCRAGTVSTYLSEDAKAFTLMFDEFVAQSGPGIAPTESRKFCNVNLDLHIPHGWQFTVFKVDYIGYASLGRGDRAMLNSTYRISGATGRTSQVTFKSQLVGAMEDSYQISDDIGIVSDVWSPCGVSRAMNIKTETRLLPRTARSPALLTVDTIDGEFKTVYKLQWRRCR